MLAIRLTAAITFGGVLTSGMFWLLWHLIGQDIDVGDKIQATRIEFSRMRQDTEVANKREEKVERERPPPTPEAPRMSLTLGGIDNTVVQLAPTIDTRGAMSKMSMTAGSDRDVLPLVRINPDYPPRALSRGVEGWVKVQFTITVTGTVKDAIVVDAQPKNMFDEAALKAISRWRYNPRVEGGVAVERVGVQTIIRFELNSEG